MAFQRTSKVPKIDQKKKTQEKAKSRLECNMHNKATSREVRRSHSTKGDPRHLIEYQSTRELSQDYLIPKSIGPSKNLRPPSISAEPIRT